MKDKLTKERQLTIEEAELATKYFHYAQSLALRVGKLLPQYADELPSIADVCLTNVVKFFKEDIKADFETYYFAAFRNAIRTMIAKEGRKGFTLVPANYKEHLSFEEFNEDNYININVQSEIENRNLINVLLTNLKERDKDICEMYYFYNYNYEEIAKKIGICGSGVRVCVLRSIKYMRERYKQLN